MKLRSIIALAISLICAPAMAQDGIGTSPLSIEKGGTSGATASAARTGLGVPYGTSVANPGTGFLEYLLPVQTLTGSSFTFASSDLFTKKRISNSGSAMTATLPPSTAFGMTNGARMTIGNVDATASLTLTAGAGTTITTTVIAPGRTLPLVYDQPNTAWRIDDNAAAVLLAPTPVRNGDILYWSVASGAWLSLAGNNSGTLCFAENSSGAPSWAACSAGSAITVGTTPIASGTPGSFLYDNGGVLGNALTASVQTTQLNPAATTSTTGLMAGLGSTCTITPTITGRVNFEIGGSGQVAAATSFSVTMHYGTGTAPANGASPAGTAVSWSARNNIVATNDFASFVVSGLVTGLAVGTAVWFDVDVLSSSNAVTLTTVACKAVEQ